MLPLTANLTYCIRKNKIFLEKFENFLPQGEKIESGEESGPGNVRQLTRFGGLEREKREVSGPLSGGWNLSGSEQSCNDVPPLPFCTSHPAPTHYSLHVAFGHQVGFVLLIRWPCFIWVICKNGDTIYVSVL